MSSNQAKPERKNGFWKLPLLLLVCSLGFIGYLSYSSSESTLETQANTTQLSKPKVGASLDVEEKSPAEIKVSEIRAQLLQKYEQQKAEKLEAPHEHNHRDTNTSVGDQTNPLNTHDHEHHDHDHADETSNQLTVIKALSPEIIQAVNEMTHQTERGTTLTTSVTGTPMVDMGETAFRAVPVATVDENGNITIAEFFGPIEQATE